MDAVRVEGLIKDYGSLRAVNGISFTIQAGEVFALLGPNGAGKTTTVEIMEGHRSRTAGKVEILGMDPEGSGSYFRQRIGIVLQSSGFEPNLSIAESVAMYRSYYENPLAVDQVLGLVGLAEKRDERVKGLSGGQQRRLDLALGLVGDPDLLFLDEPTTGFDPSARRQAWDVIANLRLLGKTILLTTHYMDEAQFLADRVAVISAGEIVAEGTPETLGGRATQSTQISFKATGRPPGTDPWERVDGRFVLSVDDPVAALNRLTSWALAEGVDVTDLKVQRPTLEDIYLQLTGAVSGE